MGGKLMISGNLEQNKTEITKRPILIKLPTAALEPKLQLFVSRETFHKVSDTYVSDK